MDRVCPGVKDTAGYQENTRVGQKTSFLFINMATEVVWKKPPCGLGLSVVSF